MGSNFPCLDTAPPLDLHDEAMTIDPRLLIYQYPCPTTEADNWDAPTFLTSRSLLECPLLDSSFPLSPYGLETPTASAAISEPKYTITYSSAPTVSPGERTDSLSRLNLGTKCTLSDMEGVFVTQQDKHDSVQQAAYRHSDINTPRNTEEHSTTNGIQGLTIQQETLNCLSSEARFIVDCRLESLPWKLIVEGYTQSWGYKSEAALGMKLNRLRKKYPVIDQMLRNSKEIRSSQAI